MKKFLTPFIKKILIHFSIIIGIILFVEVFICNYKTFLILPSENSIYQIEELNVNGLKYDETENCYIATKSNPTIEIKNINYHIKTIFVDTNPVALDKEKFNIKIEYTDETRIHNYVSYSKPLEIINGYENSRYIQEDFNGKTEKIRFTFQISNGEKITLNGIGLNQRIPFNFSFARVFSMLSISSLIYCFVMLFHYRKDIETKNNFNLVSKIVVSCLSGLLVIYVFGVIFNGFANALAQNNGTQISKELVDSFLNGQVTMLTKPSDAFLAIQDPYVPYNRYGVDYLWDHVYYNGEFYSYYGITPVIMLFLPFKLLTGFYMYDGYAVLLFSLVSIIFISLTYYKFIDKYCKKLPLVIQLAGYVILFMSCGILTNIVRPAFYEVSTSCAFMCMCIALYHLSKSNLLFNNEKLSNLNITLFTIWTSLAVLSRATYALYAICAVIIILLSFIARRKQMNKQEIISYFAYAMIPFIVFGGTQCIYNYARFNNFFEFGIKYSLTINDFTKTQFHFSYAFTSLYNFLFAMPTITDNLYFIKPNALTFGHSGYYFFETYTAIGLFNRVPLLYMIFALPFVKTNKTKKEKLVFAFKYVLPCIIIPFVIVMITWESGFAVRYYSDFAWAMVLFALFMFFYFFNKKVDENDKTAIKYYAIIFAVTMFCAILGQMAIINDFVPNRGRHIGVEDFRFTYKYYRIARELAFWY